MTEQNKLAAYAKALGPTIRKVNDLKEEVKEFKKTDEKFLALQAIVKAAQENLKAHLEESDIAGVLEEISELGKDLKEGFDAATKDTDYSAKDYGAYLKARNKDDGVVKVVELGGVFEALNEVIV